MKKKIIILFVICLMLIGCETSDYNRYFRIVDFYSLKASDTYDKNDCISCLKDIEGDICNPVEIVKINDKEVTLSDAISNDLLTKEQLDCLKEHDVIDYYRVPKFLYKVFEFIFDVFKAIG